MDTVTPPQEARQQAASLTIDLGTPEITVTDGVVVITWRNPGRDQWPTEPGPRLTSADPEAMRRAAQTLWTAAERLAPQVETPLPSCIKCQDTGCKSESPDCPGCCTWCTVVPV